MRKKRTLFGAVALLSGALLIGGEPAAAQAPAAPKLTAPIANETAIGYVMRTDGVSRAEAIRRLDNQIGQLRTAQRLTDELGAARTGGAYIDRPSGELVVTVLDDAAAETVRAAGARPSRVTRSTVDLSRELTVADAGSEIDVLANEIAVGPAAVQNVHPGATEVAGSEPCTAGFAAKDSFGFNYMFTAAHCVVNTVPVVNGVPMGDVIRFDPTHDVALVRNLAPFALQLGPHVKDPVLGFQTVLDVLPVVPGAVVCKSGRSSGHSCGSVSAVGVKATSKFGDVFDLIKTNLCATGGDSGGPLWIASSFQGWIHAAGITEGSQMYKSNGTPWSPGHQQFCGSQLFPPQPNVSVYVPLKRHLGVFQVSLITGL